MNAVWSGQLDDAVLQLEQQLLVHASGLPNDALLARIVAGQRAGISCLPLGLGLSSGNFIALMQRHFPGALFALDRHPNHELAERRGTLRQQLLELRREEWRELSELLLSGAAGCDRSERWLAEIVAAACLGADHLWRDLGMASRDQLGLLLRDNFPTLAARNDRDMKWKKFFYRQLCEGEGHYVCRSPSCEQCAGYDQCFGAED